MKDTEPIVFSQADLFRHSILSLTLKITFAKITIPQ